MKEQQPDRQPVHKGGWCKPGLGQEALQITEWARMFPWRGNQSRVQPRGETGVTTDL